MGRGIGGVLPLAGRRPDPRSAPPARMTSAPADDTHPHRWRVLALLATAELLGM